MSVVLLRSLILYILVIFAVRLMGKRQLGELQPSELVITILVSNIATLPLEDVNIPVIVGVTPILALVCFEVIVSWVNLRIPRLRKIISGSPKIIISNGKIDPHVMRELRFSVDDLLMALRGNNIFNIEDVQFAIVETTGNVSVMKKSEAETPTRSDLNIKQKTFDPPKIIVSDGIINRKALTSLGLDDQWITDTLKKQSMKLADVFIMTADTQGSCFISDKGGNAPRICKGGSS